MLLPSLSNFAQDALKNSHNSRDLAEIFIQNRRSHMHYKNVYQTFDEGEIRRQYEKIGKSHIHHPLKNVPISVKDSYGVDGFPTYGGCKTRLPEHWARDTGIVKLLRQCGAVFSGKTQMVEFALGGLGQNSHWGAPINPWDVKNDRVCGGSSCGAGVSLWDGSAMVALAADIAGSVRVPASMCGTVGFRPTQGQWRFGSSYLNICPTLDGPGILTLSVNDAHFFFHALHNNDGIFKPTKVARNLEGLKIGILKHCFEETQSDIAAVVWAALEQISGAGAELIDVSLPEYREAYDFYMDSLIGPIECASFVDTHFPGRSVIQDPLIRDRLKPARMVNAQHYLKSLQIRKQLKKAALMRMQSVDLLVTPTVPISPPRYEDIKTSSSYTRINKKVTLMTNPVNILDLSSLTMPVGKDRLGLPVGLQIVGRPREDMNILYYGSCIETLLGKPIDILGPPPAFKISTPETSTHPKPIPLS